MVGGPYDVDWNNDGVFDTLGQFDVVTHDYGVEGPVTIRIRGSYDSIQFNNGADKNKILSIVQWGKQTWTTMRTAFMGASNLQVPAADIPDFSALTSMYKMFNGASDFDGDLGAWDVTSLTYANNMFALITLSTANYESLLIGWDAQVLKAGVYFSGGNSIYCSSAATAARANMISSDSWAITDGGNQACPPAAPGTAPDLTPSTDTGVSDSDDFTTDSTPDFFVACSVIGNTITLYTDQPSANTAIGMLVCLTAATETATVTKTLAAGTHNISYTDQDGNGESGHSPSLTITMDNLFSDSFEEN